MNTVPSHLEGLRNKINERRKAIEQTRSFNVRRLQNDVQKITRQEIEFTKTLFEQMIPVKIVWNEDANKRLREIMPFTVEVSEKAEQKDGANETVAPVVEDEEKREMP